MTKVDKPLPSLKHLLHAMQGGKTKDYTFASIFFITFSIFIVFAIKPSLTTAVSLQKQESELRIIDSKYEQLIAQIITIQTSLEQVRDKLYLVDEALPEQPKLNVIMQDIQKSALDNNVSIVKINVHKINLVETEKDIFRSMTVNVEFAGTFENYMKFESDLANQRRLKKVKTLEISREEFEASGGGTLKMLTEIEGYYL